MDRTFYDVLGVGPDASAEELAEARERRAQAIGREELKPAPQHEAVAASLLQKLDQAFSVLDDAETRQAYDTALETGAPLDPQLLEEVDARFQEQYAATVERISGRVEAYVRALQPEASWSQAAACAPWDLVLEGKDEGTLRTVSLKVLTDLHPGDLVATIESAEAQLAACPAGHSQTHSFFLVAGLLLESGRLFTVAEEFNRASWAARDPTGPRAFVAYADLDGNLPVIPAADSPVPDLAQVCAAIDPEDLPDDLRPASLAPAPGPPAPSPPAPPPPAPPPEAPPPQQAAPPPAATPPAPPPPPPPSTPKVTSSSTGMKVPPPPPPVPGVLAATGDLVAEAGAVTSSSPGGERSSQSGEVFTVLVVDDERLPFQMISKALDAEPFDLHHSRTWLESREFLNEAECAVLILDLNMPTISGDKLAMYVHSHPEIQPKPRIVIHSGLPADELRRIASRIGAHACLQKGCGPEAIRDAVRSGARAYTRDQLLTGPW